MTEPIPPKKPWYKLKKVWAIVAVLLLVYFCLIPSRRVIMPETTGVVGPMTKDGEVDYFGAFEKFYIDKLNPPEDNGLRLMIAACGPRILEQTALAESVPWDKMPTDEIGMRWFENQWRPLCEHMSIDPYKKGMYFDSLDFYSDLFRRKKANAAKNQEAGITDDDPDGRKLDERLQTSPWKAEDYPEVAAWLKERSPVLDYFGMCVRKPNYVCWRQTSDYGMMGILLPDVQSQRQFARELRIRISERLGRGDIDGAWHDVMSMMTLSRCHFKKAPFFVTNLVGIAIEGLAFDAIREIIQYGNPSEEQLQRFASDLKSLPNPGSFLHNGDNMSCFDLLQSLGKSGQNNYLNVLKRNYPNQADSYLSEFKEVYQLSYLPIDMNIAGKRLTELFGPFSPGNALSEASLAGNSEAKRRFLDELDERVSEMKRSRTTIGQLLRVPLIRTRSRMLAEYLFTSWASAYPAIQAAYDRSNAQYEQALTAIALERHKLANGNYPEQLDALVPAYLDIVPIDPFTGRSISYKLAPDDQTAYIVYSFGPNKKDDHGAPEDIAGPAAKTVPDGDIVFKRTK